MLDIHSEKYVKLLSLQAFFDDSFFELIDPLEFKSLLENEGVFESDKLGRTLLFKLDRTLSKGKSGSKTILSKIREAIVDNNVSTLRFMEDEKTEIDNQSYIQIYYNQRGRGYQSQLHILVSDVEKYQPMQKIFLDIVKRFNPQYAFANLYVLDHFEHNKATGESEIDSINLEYPIDSMNINRYSGQASKGYIKDIQWLNYFSKKYLPHISLPDVDHLASRVEFQDGIYIQLSNTPFFSCADIDWINKFRSINEQSIVLS